MCAFNPLRTLAAALLTSELDLGTSALRRGYRNMPRFYFHLHNDLEAADPEGKELPSLEAARKYAAETALFTMAQVLKDEAHINFHHHIDIEDEHGNVLETVRFKDVAKVEGFPNI
jgi:hypothetical protein